MRRSEFFGSDVLHGATVQVYNILRSKDFSDEEAQLMAGAYEHNENLATKDDIAAVRTGLAEVRAELKGDIADVKSEFKEDIAALEIKTERGMHRLMLMLVTILAVILVTNP